MSFSIDRDFLHAFLSQPSSPFREHILIRFICDKLSSKRVPHFLDATGNIVIGARTKSEYLKKLKAPRIRGTHEAAQLQPLFVAHLDHPGFIGTKWISKNRLAADWHGGAPLNGLEGQSMWVADWSGHVFRGTIATAHITPSTEGPIRRELKSIEVDTTDLNSETPAPTLFGGFDFRAPVWEDDNILYTKAADDLIGSFSIVSAALKHFSRKAPASRHPFLAVLTRAEEVGFMGALKHIEEFKLGHLKQPPLFVSLEASRTLPGAEIGKGPVLRLGDASTVFHASGLKVLQKAAKQALKERFQKRIMDGGTCEATPAIAHGIPAIGISVPLGNYHNIGYEGGPDASAAERGPAPEFVHIEDIAGQAALVEALLEKKLYRDDPWAGAKKEYREWLRESRSLLRWPSKP